MGRVWTTRFALLLALSLGGQVVDDVDQPCDDDASFMDSCTLCPCCASSFSSPPVVAIAVSPPAIDAAPPELPVGSIEAPAPPTPPPILS